MVKCKDCGFCGDHYLNGIDGLGIFGFRYCKFDFINLVIVDADAQKECILFKKKEEESQHEKVS
jgi:hypothetical protein